MFTAAELGDYNEDIDVNTFVEKLALFPKDGDDHVEEILQEYKTLK